MTTIRIAFVLLVAGAVLPQVAQAQADSTVQTPASGRKGFWWGFGLGGGWSWESPFGFDSQRGGAAYFRLGGTVNQHVLFGADIVTWFTESNHVEFGRVNVTASAMVYPWLTKGLFFQGGFGVANTEVNGNETSTGIGVTVGGGYDLRIGGNLYVTSNLATLIQFYQHDTNASLVFTLGLTWH